MSFPLLRISVLALLAAVTGCAQQPVQPAATTPATASAAIASAPAQGAPRSNPYGIPNQLLQTARDEGYRPTMRDGQAYFCRRHIPIGSSLPRTRCVNSVTLRFDIQQQQQQRQALEQGATLGSTRNNGG